MSVLNEEGLRYFWDKVCNMVSEKTASNGGGGTTSIDVTASVGQTIIVKEVDENGKPTKWEAVDHQERTHWEIDNAHYIPETTLAINEDGVCMVIGNIDIIEGETYTVNYNGTSYECVCVEVEGVSYLGDVSVLGGTESTGEPFCIASMIDNGEIIYIILPIDGAQSVTMSILGKEIVKIPDKYMSDSIKPLYVDVYPDEPLSVTPEYLLSQYFRGREIFARYDGGAILIQCNYGNTTYGPPICIPMVSISYDGVVAAFSSAIIDDIGAKIVTITIENIDGVYMPTISSAIVTTS